MITAVVLIMLYSVHAVVKTKYQLLSVPQQADRNGIPCSHCWRVRSWPYRQTQERGKFIIKPPVSI